jgi:hypothetical protein
MRGRPKGLPKQQATFRITDATRALIDHAAFELGTSRSEALAELVERGADAQRSQLKPGTYALLLNAGHSLIAVAFDPSNRKHVEAFAKFGALAAEFQDECAREASAKTDRPSNLRRPLTLVK